MSNKYSGYLGKTSDGSRVWAVIKLTPQTSGSDETVDHQPAVVWERASFTVQGRYKGSQSKRHGDYDFGGANTDVYKEITAPAKGWTVAEVRALGRLAEEWHLNDVQAGCVHQTVVYAEDRYGRNVPSLGLTPPCPITGYKYGHAWLVKPLTAEAQAAIRAFGGKLDGTDALS